MRLLTTFVILSAAAWSGLIPAHAKQPTGQTMQAEVVVYGGTDAGVTAATAAAREGRTVLIVEPSRWIGGLLGAGFRISEDTPFAETLGGLTRKFLDADVSWGGSTLDWKANANQRLFREMMAPYAGRIRIVYEHRLRSVAKKGERIAAIEVEYAPPDQDGVPASEARPDGLLRVEGKIFIDASYEGDLLARAGVTHHVGRESREEFGESLAGVCGVHPFPGVSPYVKEGDPSSGLLPMISPDPLGEPGSASRFVQGYNFKFAWLRNPTAEKPGIPMGPPEEDPAMDELLRRINKAGYRITWPHFNDERREVCTGTIPGLQGDYPEGDWSTRARIWRASIEHLKRLNAFTGKDVRLLTDENADTGGWPHQLYVRTARLMRGRYVMKQADIALQTDIPDSIGIGFYAVDLHPARLVVLPDGTLAHEGETLILVSPGPYRIPYRSITPKAEECENLLVPVCLSATHFAYGSIRMEAHFMVIGESAGVAAAQALAEGKPVQDIDVPRLQARLRALGQKLAWDGKGYGRWRTSLFHKTFSTSKPRWETHPEEYPRFRPAGSPGE